VHLRLQARALCSRTPEDGLSAVPVVATVSISQLHSGEVVGDGSFAISSPISSALAALQARPRVDYAYGEGSIVHDSDYLTDSSEEDDDDDSPPPPEEEELLIIPDGCAIVSTPPSSESLDPHHPSSAALVGRRLIRRWPGYGWCHGQITRTNTDCEEVIDGDMVNFFVLYCIDRHESEHRIHITHIHIHIYVDRHESEHRDRRQQQPAQRAL